MSNDLIQDVLINSGLKICAQSASKLLMCFWQHYLFNVTFPGADIPPPKKELLKKVPPQSVTVISLNPYPHLITSLLSLVTSLKFPIFNYGYLLKRENFFFSVTLGRLPSNSELNSSKTQSLPPDLSPLVQLQCLTRP